LARKQHAAGFSSIFPRKVIFRWIFLGISWGNDFSKLFLRKFPIFCRVTKIIFVWVNKTS
jgi:hypothetical protein